MSMKAVVEAIATIENVADVESIEIDVIEETEKIGAIHRHTGRTLLQITIPYCETPAFIRKQIELTSDEIKKCQDMIEALTDKCNYLQEQLNV